MVSQLKWSFILDGQEIGDPSQAGSGYVTVQTKVKHTRTNASTNSAELHVSNDVDATKVPVVGQTVVVSRGVTTATEDYIFRGHVKRVSRSGNKYILSCKTTINQLAYELFNKSYDINIDTEAGELSAIFDDIGTNGGFTVSVESSGTAAGDITAVKFIANRDSRLNRMNLIAKILNWYFYEDYNLQQIRLEPKGYSIYATALVVGTNITNVPKWVQNLEPMRNKLEIHGALEEDTREENEVGDAVTATFSFEFTPETTNCTVDGVLQKQGVEGSTDTYDYTIDKDRKTYTFETGSIPGGSAAIIMQYSALLPRPVIGSDAPSIAQYGLIQDDDYTFKDIFTVDDAETRLNQLLALLKDGEVDTIIYTDEYTITVGQQVNVTDQNDTTKNGNYIVFEKVMTYGDSVDKLSIGNERINVSDIIKTIDERLKLLEGSDKRLSEILRHLIRLPKALGLGRTSLTLTHRKICDSFVLDSAVNSLMDQGIILDDFESGNSGNWSGTSMTISDEGTIVKASSGSLKSIWAGGVATGYLTSNQSFGDVSEYTGSASGTPSKGTVGLWVYVAVATDMTDIKLRIGSGASDYTEMSAKAYASVDGYDQWSNLSFSLQVGWNYMLFDLDGGSETGTPDWTGCDYARLEFELAGNATFYLDYFTISKSNFIGLNGSGYRVMEV